MAAASMHPAAPHYLPAFITAPGESDLFLNGSAIFLVVLVLMLGSVYFRLHALPEHMAHRNANKLQFEVVAVLALLALFTHNNMFWVAALLLALVPIPDFHGPVTTMAQSLARMAGLGRRKDGSIPDVDDDAAAAAAPSHEPPELPVVTEGSRHKAEQPPPPAGTEARRSGAES